MKTIKKQPKIRFKGYTDEWQQRKLGEIIQVNSGKDYKHLNKGEIPVYGTGGYMLSVDEALSYKDAIGLGRKGTINKPYLLKAPFWTVDTLFYSIPINNNDLLFINTLFQNINWKKYDESTGVPSLSKNSIIRIEKKVPNIEEQEKIGLFFLKLSDTIALHQRKLEALEKTKKSFLQKMFPKKDETKPEIRFSGFTDDWEQRKLIEVSEMYNNLRIPVTASDRIAGNTPYYGANGIQDYVDGFTHSGEYVLLAEDGANDLLNYPVHYVNGTVWVNNHAHVISGKSGQLYNLFLVSRMKSMNIIPWLVGGGRAKLNGEVLKKIPILLPSYPEQKKIGTFFKQLDDTIALHQRQLEVLKNMKTSFLQKMYI